MNKATRKAFKWVNHCEFDLKDFIEEMANAYQWDKDDFTELCKSWLDRVEHMKNLTVPAPLPPVEEWNVYYDYKDAEKVWLKSTGLAVGDEVLVTRKPTEAELDNWPGTWLDKHMDSWIGKKATVIDIREDFGIRLQSDDGNWLFPYQSIVPTTLGLRHLVENSGTYQNIGREEFPLEDYKPAQEAWVKDTGLKVGDTVLVERKPTERELDNWPLGWVDNVNKCVGEELEVINIFTNGIQLKCVGGRRDWFFPFYCLSKVTKKF